MQWIRFAGLLMLIYTFTACNRDGDRVEVFELSQAMDFEIPAGLNIIESHFFVQNNLFSNYDALLDASGAVDENIISIEPKFARLSTVFGDEDLDFIRLVEVRVFDPFDPDFIREAFYLDPVPPNTNTAIRPFPGLADLKGILAQPTFGVQVRLVFLRIPRRNYDMRLEMDFSAFR